MTTPRELRSGQAAGLAAQLGVDPDALDRAADAVWSNMNPDRVPYERALSIAGVALKEAARCRICGGIGGDHDGAVHDARVADMPPGGFRSDIDTPTATQTTEQSAVSGRQLQDGSG